MSQKYIPQEAEALLQKFWEEEKIYAYDPKSDKEIFSIDTPPPTVSGSIHIGHIFSYTQTEVTARFQRMLGKNVFYPFGFDDNGLPTERLVEKRIGKKASELERKDFADQCLTVTAEYREAYKILWQSMGMSVDWSLAYSTVSEETQRISQLSFLRLLKDKEVEQKNAAALFCPECQTSVAQAEVDDAEKDSFFHDIRFTTETYEDFIIATTRPEMLPACLCVFVHPNDERFAHLVGKNAVTPLGTSVPILTDDLVDPEKGSGLVMCCSYGDETDLLWVKKHDLTEKIILTKTGHMKNTGRDDLDGLYLKKARKVIVEILKDHGSLVESKPIKHAVKVHERCGTPMEILPIPQWFIGILERKQEFLDIADEVNWYPEYMKSRYVQWVENLKWDWAISRQRFFGVSIPVWHSKITGEYILPEESDLPVDPLKQAPKNLPEGHTLEDIYPDPDVLDTWATSSLTPEINAKWGAEDDRSDKILPMSMRPQAHDIIRTWAFYTIVKSKLHHGRKPWNDIVISGHVLAGKKEKISKSKGNAKTTPEELINKYSADAVRYWAMGGTLGKDIVFDEQEIAKGKKLVNKVWNASNFALQNLEEFHPENLMELSQREPSDIWVMKRLEKTATKMKQHLSDFQFHHARQVFEDFFWTDFCDNYLEIVKTRMYQPEAFENGAQKKLSAQSSVYECIFTIIKLLAPFMPHVTEQVYQSYFKQFESEKSIHLCLYPVLSFDKNILPEVESDMEMFLELINLVRKYKTENQLKLSEELKSLQVTAPSVEKLSAFMDDIKGVTKAKACDILQKDGDVELKVER